MNKKKPSYIVIIFWSIIAIISLIFITLIVVKIIENNKINSLEDMTNLEGEALFNQEGDYYIYVYSNLGITDDKFELEKAEALAETILNYLTYIDKNSKNPEIYGMYGMIVDQFAGSIGNFGRIKFGEGNTSTNGASSFSELSINAADVPILLKISGGKVTAQFLSQNDIENELQKAMNPTSDDK